MFSQHPLSGECMNWSWSSNCKNVKSLALHPRLWVTGRPPHLCSRMRSSGLPCSSLLCCFLWWSHRPLVVMWCHLFSSLQLLDLEMCCFSQSLKLTLSYYYDVESVLTDFSSVAVLKWENDLQYPFILPCFAGSQSTSLSLPCLLFHFLQRSQLG